MMPMSLTEIAQAVDGRLMPTTVPTDEPVAISAFTDSRQIVPGSVFVAIAGERVDGHDFVPKVGAQGAVAALVDHEIAGAQVPQIVVENTVKALGALAKHNIERRRALESPFTVIGITGSVGKTTTKDLLKSLLSKMGDTVAPVGSFNNEIGLPLTLMRMTKDTEVMVAEMGMNHFGELSRMTASAQPDYAVITNIGTSHIEFLGSREGICKAKLEICNGLPEGAPLVLNYDDKFLRAAKLPAHVRPVWFSLADESADVCALSIRQEKDGMSFVLEDQEEGTFVVRIPAMGKHNVANALAAYCAATRLGCDPRKVIQGLAAFEQTGRRQKVVDSKGVTVIEDCYNANPDSMKAALAMFKEFPCKRRFALLGDMLELGDLSREAHEELGRLAAESDLYCLVTYGEQAKRTAVVAAAKGQKTLHANNYREAADALLNRIQPGDALLVKASRGMALEKALEIFYAEQKDARE